MWNMLCLEGRVALGAFTVFALITVHQFHLFNFEEWSWKYPCALYASSAVLVCLIPQAAVAKRAALLGALFGAALGLIFVIEKWQSFGGYIAALSFFHFSEYMLIAIYNTSTLSVDSFLINHSIEYQLAAAASWVEFFIEYYFFPQVKSIKVITLIGIGFLITGEVIRKLAMITASSNFSHIVQVAKQPDHRLVTHGIYQYMRHPSYAGWFCWSIGTQVLLCNPVCLIGYMWASWNFFYDRIREEEYYLLNFFGEDYMKYMTKVGTGIPFNTGLEKEVQEILKSD